MMLNLDEHRSIGTHWIGLYVNDDDITYSDSFEVKYISKEIKKFINNKTTMTNIYRIHANDSTMCGYFCTGLIDFMLKSKS